MGRPFEGQAGPLQFRDHRDWKISDQSQLTLATCESIIEAGTVSPEQIAERFLQWFRDRRITGMGASTLKTLRDLAAGLPLLDDYELGRERNNRDPLPARLKFAIASDPTEPTYLEVVSVTSS